MSIGSSNYATFGAAFMSAVTPTNVTAIFTTNLATKCSTVIPTQQLPFCATVDTTYHAAFGSAIVATI